MVFNISRSYFQPTSAFQDSLPSEGTKDALQVSSAEEECLENASLLQSLFINLIVLREAFYNEKDLSQLEQVYSDSSRILDIVIRNKYFENWPEKECSPIRFVLDLLILLQKRPKSEHIAFLYAFIESKKIFNFDQILIFEVVNASSDSLESLSILNLPLLQSPEKELRLLLNEIDWERERIDFDFYLIIYLVKTFPSADQENTLTHFFLYYIKTEFRFVGAAKKKYYISTYLQFVKCLNAGKTSNTNKNFEHEFLSLINELPLNNLKSLDVNLQHATACEKFQLQIHDFLSKWSHFGVLSTEFSPQIIVDLIINILIAQDSIKVDNTIFSNLSILLDYLNLNPVYETNQAFEMMILNIFLMFMRNDLISDQNKPHFFNLLNKFFYFNAFFKTMRETNRLEILTDYCINFIFYSHQTNGKQPAWRLLSLMCEQSPIVREIIFEKINVAQIIDMNKKFSIRHSQPTGNFDSLSTLWLMRFCLNCRDKSLNEADLISIIKYIDKFINLNNNNECNEMEIVQLINLIYEIFTLNPEVFIREFYFLYQNAPNKKIKKSKNKNRNKIPNFRESSIISFFQSRKGSYFLTKFQSNSVITKISSLELVNNQKNFLKELLRQITRLNNEIDSLRAKSFQIGMAQNNCYLSSSVERALEIKSVYERFFPIPQKNARDFTIDELLSEWDQSLDDSKEFTHQRILNLLNATLSYLENSCDIEKLEQLCLRLMRTVDSYNYLSWFFCFYEIDLRLSCIISLKECVKIKSILVNCCLYMNFRAKETTHFIISMDEILDISKCNKVLLKNTINLYLAKLSKFSFEGVFDVIGVFAFFFQKQLLDNNDASWIITVINAFGIEMLIKGIIQDKPPEWRNRLLNCFKKVFSNNNFIEIVSKDDRTINSLFYVSCFLLVTYPDHSVCNMIKTNLKKVVIENLENREACTPIHLMALKLSVLIFNHEEQDLYLRNFKTIKSYIVLFQLKRISYPSATLFSSRKDFFHFASQKMYIYMKESTPKTLRHHYLLKERFYKEINDRCNLKEVYLEKLLIEREKEWNNNWIKKLPNDRYKQEIEKRLKEMCHFFKMEQFNSWKEKKRSIKNVYSNSSFNKYSEVKQFYLTLNAEVEELSNHQMKAVGDFENQIACFKRAHEEFVSEKLKSDRKLQKQIESVQKLMAASNEALQKLQNELNSPALEISNLQHWLKQREIQIASAIEPLRSSAAFSPKPLPMPLLVTESTPCIIKEPVLKKTSSSNEEQAGEIENLKALLKSVKKENIKLHKKNISLESALVAKANSQVLSAENAAFEGHERDNSSFPILKEELLILLEQESALKVYSLPLKLKSLRRQLNSLRSENNIERQDLHKLLVAAGFEMMTGNGGSHESYTARKKERPEGVPDVRVTLSTHPGKSCDVSEVKNVLKAIQVHLSTIFADPTSF